MGKPLLEWLMSLWLIWKTGSDWLTERKAVVLHVLSVSSPVLNGYAIRTSGILKAQNESGQVDVLALTSPYYPQRTEMLKEHTESGVTYRRCAHPWESKDGGFWDKRVAKWAANRLKLKGDKKESWLKSRLMIPFRLMNKGLMPPKLWIEENVLMKRLEVSIDSLCEEYGVDIIHAHTPYRVAEPALNVARRRSIPLVYEMRGMWEETAVANDRWKRWGPAFKRFRRKENKVMRAADHMVCISNTLRTAAVSRGVSEDKITVVPNAVDTSRFDSVELDAEQTTHLDETKSALDGSFVVGYIGSLRSMEGVEETVDAVAELLSRGRKVKLLVVSSSANRSELIFRAESLGISENTLFTGPVPPEFIKPYFQLIDAFVVSRPDTEVTRMVTPLKPLEAMLLGVPVVCSDLPALRELMDNGSKGHLYAPGDVSGLADALEKVMDSADIPASSMSAADWVEQNRNWNVVNEETLRVYSDLLPRAE